jgi:hypothetical protein
VGQLTSLITGKLIAFDTGPLIYYIEEHPDYLSRADELFSALDSGAALDEDRLSDRKLFR